MTTSPQPDHGSGGATWGPPIASSSPSPSTSQVAPHDWAATSTAGTGPDRHGAKLVDFRSVSKWYGAVMGVNEVSFSLEPGITGLLGANGAGKTTLIKLMAGQLRPSLGDVSICGLRAWTAAAKAHVGYCPDVDTFYEEMSGRAFVQTMARLHGYSPRAAAERTEAVLAEVGMSDRADRRLRGYSKGMRQRIKLAQAIVHDPDVLVVDEPLNGIDPFGRHELMEVLRSLGRRGKTVLISSHILHEMDTLAERVIFMGHGRVLATGTLAEIRNMFDQHPLHLHIASDRSRELASRLVRWDLVRGIELRGPDDFRVQIMRPSDFFPRFSELVLEEGYEIERLQTTDASASAIFDYVMQEAAHF
jgi:ABC-2 type transport system ATP-binding protein